MSLYSQLSVIVEPASETVWRCPNVKQVVPVSAYIYILVKSMN